MWELRDKASEFEISPSLAWRCCFTSRGVSLIRGPDLDLPQGMSSLGLVA